MLHASTEILAVDRREPDLLNLRFAAEFIGTMLLLAAIVGSGIRRIQATGESR